VIVFLGERRWNFSVGQSVCRAYGTASIVVEDFNSDGKMDVAMSGCGLIAGCLEWALVGNGDGSFQEPQFFGPTMDPLDGASALGTDINGDGKGDLVWQGNPSFLDTAEIYLGNGDGTRSKTKNNTLVIPHSRTRSELRSSTSTALTNRTSLSPKLWSSAMAMARFRENSDRSSEQFSRTEKCRL
jgi:hypothetical protein